MDIGTAMKIRNSFQLFSGNALIYNRPFFSKIFQVNGPKSKLEMRVIRKRRK